MENKPKLADNKLLASFEEYHSEPFALEIGQTCKMSIKHFRAIVEIINQKNKYTGDNAIPESHFIRAFRNAKMLADDCKEDSDFIFQGIIPSQERLDQEAAALAQEQESMSHRSQLVEAHKKNLSIIQRMIERNSLKDLYLAIQTFDEVSIDTIIALNNVKNSSTDFEIINQLRDNNQSSNELREDLIKIFSSFPSTPVSAADRLNYETEVTATIAVADPDKSVNVFVWTLVVLVIVGLANVLCWIPR